MSRIDPWAARAGADQLARRDRERGAARDPSSVGSPANGANMDHRKRQTSRDDAPSMSGGKLHRPAHDAGRCRGGWRSLDRVVSELRTPGRARSIEVAARFTHLRALNGVTDQHRHGSHNPYHRSRCGSGPKAVGPRLRVTENFRPIDHCRLHQDTRWTDFIGALLQRLGGSVAPQKVERPHYGIVSCQAKRTTTVASARPQL